MKRLPNRLIAGRFTFIALLKSIRCGGALTGPSAALADAIAAVLAFCRESGVSRAEAPRSKLMLLHSDNVQTVGEDMGTSTAQPATRHRSRLEVERPGW